LNNKDIKNSYKLFSLNESNEICPTTDH